LFFFSLIVYLRREDRREGYPLEDDVNGRLEPTSGALFTATAKHFLLPHNLGVVVKPNADRDAPVLNAARTSPAAGSPMVPTGDPMTAGLGPGSFAHRAKRPDLMADGTPKIAPLALAHEYSVDAKDHDPRGKTVLGADRAVAGIVTEVWVDRMEFMIRYLEVALPAPPATGLNLVGSAPAAKTVLVPMVMATVSRSGGPIKVDAILASQFAGVPALAQPGQITLDEEERICAYFGAGYLYATPARTEPLI
jgi:photosynthetic reaction center H subunit